MGHNTHWKGLSIGTATVTPKNVIRQEKRVVGPTLIQSARKRARLSNPSSHSGARTGQRRKLRAQGGMGTAQPTTPTPVKLYEVMSAELDGTVGRGGRFGRLRRAAMGVPRGLEADGSESRHGASGKLLAAKVTWPIHAATIETRSS